MNINKMYSIYVKSAQTFFKGAGVYYTVEFLGIFSGRRLKKISTKCSLCYHNSMGALFSVYCISV